MVERTGDGTGEKGEKIKLVDTPEMRLEEGKKKGTKPDLIVKVSNTAQRVAMSRFYKESL